MTKEQEELCENIHNLELEIEICKQLKVSYKSQQKELNKLNKKLKEVNK